MKAAKYPFIAQELLAEEMCLTQIVSVNMTSMAPGVFILRDDSDSLFVIDADGLRPVSLVESFRAYIEAEERDDADGHYSDSGEMTRWLRRIADLLPS